MGYVKGKSKNLIVKKIIIDTITVLISLIILFVNNCNHYYNSINVIIEHRYCVLLFVLYISIFNYNNNIIIIELLKLL